MAITIEFANEVNIMKRTLDWATVGLYQKALRTPPADPAEPLPLSATPIWSAMAP